MHSTTIAIGGDLSVARVGFGAMRITGPDVYGPPSDHAKAIAVIRRAVELGADFIDTADQYGPFVSEELVAEALEGVPSRVVVATKGGLVRFGNGSTIKYDATPQHLHDALDGSLRRLRRDQIDLYQLHRIDPDVPPEVSFAFLRDAQRDGRIRHIGLSEVTIAHIDLAQEYFPVVSVQNRYSLLDRAAEPVLQYCREHGIAFIPWYPIGGGTLRDDATLTRIATVHGVGVRQIALAWLLHHADNILLIPGTSDPNHLEENMAVTRLALDADEMSALDALDGSVAR